MTPETVYEWVREPYGPVAAATIAFVRPMNPERCLDLLAPDRQTEVLEAEDVREWAADQDHPYGTALEAGAVKAWTVVYENNGYRAVSDGLPEKLSEHGQMLAIHRGGQGVVRFVHARGGIVVRSFEPGFAWSQIGDPLPEESDLDFDGADSYPNLFRLAERLTGQRMPASYLRDCSGRIAVGLHPD